MMHRVGQALGDEAAAKKAHVLLGPTVNVQRSPLGGRGFESYSEDPHLSGLSAFPFSSLSQQPSDLSSLSDSRCCLRQRSSGEGRRRLHQALRQYVFFPFSFFLCGFEKQRADSRISAANDQEFERFSMDSVVSQRALREIYLEPFRLAVKHANPKTFMTSYNSLNGKHCSETKELLEGILRGEWGWRGLTMFVFSSSSPSSSVLPCTDLSPVQVRLDWCLLHRRVDQGRSRCVRSRLLFTSPENSR
jgi:beta-glucosidase